MTNKTNRQIVLAARPVGAPKESDFDMVETAVPAPGDEPNLAANISVPIVLFVGPRADLTDRVVQKMNNDFENNR